MNDRPPVRVGEPFRHLDRVIEERLERQMPTAAIERVEERLERAARQILEDEELPIFHLLNVEQGGNVRVVENGERHRLLHEAPAGIAGERQTGGEKLQGNQAVQFEV